MPTNWDKSGVAFALTRSGDAFQQEHGHRHDADGREHECPREIKLMEQLFCTMRRAPTTKAYVVSCLRESMRYLDDRQRELFGCGQLERAGAHVHAYNGHREILEKLDKFLDEALDRAHIMLVNPNMYKT